MYLSGLLPRPNLLSYLILSPSLVDQFDLTVSWFLDKPILPPCGLPLSFCCCSSTCFCNCFFTLLVLFCIAYDFANLTLEWCDHFHWQFLILALSVFSESFPSRLPLLDESHTVSILTTIFFNSSKDFWHKCSSILFDIQSMLTLFGCCVVIRN